MDRRTFLGGTAAAALTATTAGCAGTVPDDQSGPREPARPPSSSPPQARGSVPAPGGAPTPADWNALAASLDGTLVRPGDRSWTTARQLYNTRFDTLRPAAVAYPAHPEDVRTALGHARAHGVPVALRSGGHSYAGWSSGDGRLIIDVSALDRVRASGDEAVIGAGAKLIDVYRALAARGTTLPAGSCPTVGISGLVLGGGHGVVSRAYGLTCDHLTGATLITADGRRLTADATENPDLFWALRGAGNGTFGVVTELRFRTRPAPQAVSAYLTWPWSRAGRLVAAWQRWGPDQPDEIWSSLHLEAVAGRGPAVSLAAFSLGTLGDLQNAVDRLAAQTGASASHVSFKRRSYREAMEVYAGCSSFPTDARCHLSGSTPGRAPEGGLARETYAARSDFFDRDIPAAGVTALLDRLRTVSGGAGSVSFTALGGAVNRVAPTATAFVHRRSRTLAQYLASWPAGGDGAASRNWLASVHGAMRPYASGAAYQNYTDPELKDWRTAYYGDAAPRLTALKDRYDPDRVFTSPQGL
ncbi:FAD-binding oxidoreductase [Streptomyces tagetis]|uniref:FAD-binding oxidoreductase n=1 Tax=Streptomyces tagetis TaxID=2820809 RepID=A0A940XR45_9ACTN|nr:FAD-binding oxidoreductase [Streptomyces sp. RG38]MBQ0830781.1 FAD-binding oxidoreductase [Streptomyces sp. RG38]